MADNHFKIHKGVTLAPQSAEPSNPIDGDMYYDSTFNKFRKFENGAWSDFGSGALGIINYIDNSGIENDTSGYTTYDDAGAYVDGTGGSPSSITISRTEVTAEILRGAGSLKISKAASDATGEGVSIATETIGIVDRGKVLNGSFEMDFTDANYTSSDVVIKAFDITNAEEITNLNDQLGAVFKSKGRYDFKITTKSNTEQVRISFHVETDSDTGSAWDVFVDDVKLSPTQEVTSAIVTQWEPYIPALTGFGTATNVSFFSRRIGDSLQLRGSFTSGTPTAVEARVDLPNSLISDSSIDTLEAAGIWFRGVATPGNGGAMFIEPAVGYITFGDQATFSDSSVNPMLKQDGDAIIGSGETVNIPPMSIKIEGFSSGAQISTTENLFKTATVHAFENGGEVLTADVTDITWSTIATDNIGAWDGQKFTAPVDGDYLITGNVHVTSAGIHQIESYIDGIIYRNVSGNTDTNNLEMSGIIPLLKGEELSFRSDTNKTLVNLSTDHWISIKAMPDLSVFTITGEKASAYVADEKASGTDGGTFTSGSFIKRDLNTIIKDGPSFMSIASDVMTVQPGRYRVRFSASAHKVDGNQTRLRNTTAGSTSIVGSTEDTNTADNTLTRSIGAGIITISEETNFELQHDAAVTRATDGYGDAVNSGEVEVYSQVEWIKIA